MNKYTYNEYTKCYFYTCSICCEKVANYFVNDCLCNTCYDLYQAELNKLKDEYNFNAMKYPYLTGNDVVKLENQIKEFETKVVVIKKKYNIN